ncbi:MAG: GntR family transcriptional regulator [Lachnospiraceae bacterium]|nr:GntR family transcriptional regulator [Lachnospiraceae bacterium]
MKEKKKQLLYMKLKEELLKEYEDKPYYSPLPSERKLCDMYHVSRPTVRKALQILEQDGCIAKISDKGAFFVGNSNKKGITHQLAHATNISFYNQVRLNGDSTRSRILTQKVETASEELVKILRLKVGARVFHLERLRYINSELWTISDAYISYDLCPELMEHDFIMQSLHNTLSSYGHVPAWADRKIVADRANGYDALNLGLKEGDPICVARTITYDANDYPLEYSVNREDFYHMTIGMTIKNNPNADEKNQYINII